MNRKRLYIFFAALSLAGYAWIGWNAVGQSGHESVPTFCLFKEVTGLPCPSCGTTRSLIALIHGHLQKALFINPLGLLMALALLIIPAWIVSDTLTRNDSFFRNYNLIERIFATKKWVAVFAVAVILLNWFWNIKKGL